MTLFLFIASTIGFLVGLILSWIKLPYNPDLDYFRKIIALMLIIISFPVMIFTLGDIIR
jgi:hypothetical protein